MKKYSIANLGEFFIIRYIHKVYANTAKIATFQFQPKVTRWH